MLPNSANWMEIITSCAGQSYAKHGVVGPSVPFNEVIPVYTFFLVFFICFTLQFWKELHRDDTSEVQLSFRWLYHLEPMDDVAGEASGPFHLLAKFFRRGS